MQGIRSKQQSWPLVMWYLGLPKYENFDITSNPVNSWTETSACSWNCSRQWEYPLGQLHVSRISKPLNSVSALKEARTLSISESSYKLNPSSTLLRSFGLGLLFLYSQSPET
eukprot:GABU01000495.1.p1 GENE.GABU01000495.1~~GABU01000495.1.p1  ORF type:complete len:112 (-),score=2.83 GABU01000495.1:86-421(-)